MVLLLDRKRIKPLYFIFYYLIEKTLRNIRSVVLELECGGYQTLLLDSSDVIGYIYERQKHNPIISITKSIIFRRISFDEIYEPPRGKTNNVVSEQVWHKSGCTVTEAGYKLEISDLRRRGSVLSV